MDEARIALDRAKSAQLQAALYLSVADDAASTESPSLQELEEALKNATAAADTKEREVKGIEAEIAAYAAELETATQQLKMMRKPASQMLQSCSKSSRCEGCF